MGAEARGSDLLRQHNALSDGCKVIVESLEAKFAETDAATKDVERRAAVVVAEQQTGIENIFVGLEAKLPVSFAAQGEQNEKVQQQLAQAEKTFKAAAVTGGAGTLKDPKSARSTATSRS